MSRVQSPFVFFAHQFPVGIRLISRSLSYFRQLFSFALSRPLSFPCLPLSPLSSTHADFVFSLHFLFGQQQSKHLWLSDKSRTGSPSRRPCNDSANLFAAQSQQPPLHFLLSLYSLTLNSFIFSFFLFLWRCCPADKKNAAVRRN